MSESIYLNSLEDPRLGLLSPMPLEITGKSGNFVATWMEGGIEGEGATKQAAVDDCRQAIIARFKALRDRASGRLSGAEDREWHGLLYFISEPGKRVLAPGEDYTSSHPADDDYKGPFFG